MPLSQSYVADTKKWTDFFMKTANKSMLSSSLLQKGGNLGNGTINNSKIVAVDSGYLTHERKNSSTPEITMVSSTQRDLQQAKSELRREHRDSVKKKRKNRKRKHSDNFD
jgi:hypothetical protein